MSTITLPDETITPSSAVSFGFAQATRVPAATILDLTGVAYDPRRQVTTTATGRPAVDLPQLKSVLATETVDDSVRRPDKQQD